MVISKKMDVDVDKFVGFDIVKMRNFFLMVFVFLINFKVGLFVKGEIEEGWVY